MPGGTRNPWSEVELNYLREYYGKLPISMIGRLLGRPNKAITGKASTLGLASLLEKTGKRT